MAHKQGPDASQIDRTAPGREDAESADEECAPGHAGGDTEPTERLWWRRLFD